jgi:hypothetical protein
VACLNVARQTDGKTAALLNRSGRTPVARLNPLSSLPKPRPGEGKKPALDFHHRNGDHCRLEMGRFAAAGFRSGPVLVQTFTGAPSTRERIKESGTKFDRAAPSTSRRPAPYNGQQRGQVLDLLTKKELQSHAHQAAAHPQLIEPLPLRAVGRDGFPFELFGGSLPNTKPQKTSGPLRQTCLDRGSGPLFRRDQPEPVRAVGSVVTYQVCWGSSPAKGSGSPQVRMSRNPISPQVPAFLGRWIFDGSPPFVKGFGSCCYGGVGNHLSGFLGNGDGKDTGTAQDRRCRNHRATTSSYRSSRSEEFQQYPFYSWRKAVQAKRRIFVASRLPRNNLGLRFPCDSHMTQAGAQT